MLCRHRAQTRDPLTASGARANKPRVSQTSEKHPQHDINERRPETPRRSRRSVAQVGAAAARSRSRASRCVPIARAIRRRPLRIAALP